ncbi:MAG: hypothetical protein KJ964_07905 [Verrucomicrobia bacterium]|nr:hypothetical protein [Verrucomicrobiota bacterium]MBU1733738.1 hypothetical protein [Verrucomicrobiota bacterium]MBU1855421.1 hypothetical protein [Verrucomicrobiota bacterium]
MRILQIVLIVVTTLVLIAVLQLPDRARDISGADFTALPESDLRTLAEANWEAGRRGAALEVLDYIDRNKVAGWLVAAGQRDKYRATLRTDTTALGHLTALGTELEPDAAAGSFESLAGRCVADGMIHADIPRLITETSQGANSFITRINEADTLSALFPQAELAFALLKAATCIQAIQPPLQNQLTDCLAAVRSSPGSSLSMAAAQDALMPVYQLAKTCKTWTEFAILLKQARSLEQLKVLIKMASTTPSSAAKLTQVLIVAGTEAPQAATRAIDVILKQGPAGLDLLYAAVRKGPAGVAWIGDHPAVTLASLNELNRSRVLAPTQLVKHWLAFRSVFGVKATLLKYLVVAGLCSILLVSLIPTVSKTGVAGIKQLAGRKNYWIAATAVGATISLLLMLGALVPGPSPDGGGLKLESNGTGPTTSSGNMNAISMAIMVAGILIVQGICWVIAHRRIRDVENDTDTDLPTRLKRMENLDIFLDLPLYCGLAVTIFSFILITTYGVGVARFLAYSSTLVGIVLAVVLRLFYLYPLRESLITGKE